MSHVTLLENYRKAGMLHDGETPTDEIERIKKDEIKPVGFNTDPKPDVSDDSSDSDSDNSDSDSDSIMNGFIKSNKD